MKWRKSSGSKKMIRMPSAALKYAIFSAVYITLAVTPSYAEPPVEEAEKSVIKGADIATLITQLGDEAYSVRVASMVELWSRGPVAIPELRRAAENNSDPEVSSRASELALYISAGVLPDSPEEVKELVIQFSRSKINEKLTILRKLMSMGQWKQVLHLANSEKNAESSKKMSALVQQAATRSARVAIISGDNEQAREILELIPDDEQNMLLRAWFYVHNGQLKEQLEKADSMSEGNAVIWRMSLHRANGDYRAAIVEAKKAGLSDLATGMQVLAGDPLPWIQTVAVEESAGAALRMGNQIQIAKLLGQKKKADLIASKLTLLHHDEETATLAANCLAANGYSKEALDLMIKGSVDEAFEYYDAIESPQKCLDLLGIPKTAKPPYKAWVNEITPKALDDEVLQNRLIMLTGFLDRHGMSDHAIEVIRPLMKGLEENGDERWFDILYALRRSDLGWMAFTFAKERGNEDGVMDLSVTKILGSNNEVRMVWAALQKLHPEDVDQSLHEIALLAGLIPDTNNETDKVHQFLLKSVVEEENKEGGIKNSLTKALYTFAFQRNNIVEAARLVDLSFEDDKDRERIKSSLDASLHRWVKVEPFYAKSAKEQPGDYINLIKWCITLRKLGRKEEAAKIYERAFMLTMGHASALRRIGLEFSEAGYDKEAAHAWEASLIMSAAGSKEFHQVLPLLAQGTEYLYDSKQWQKAAAIHEVYTALLTGGKYRGYLRSGLRARFYADFCHAMHMLENGQRDRALSKLDICIQLIPGDGSLADHFFPALRNVGVGKHYERWFEESYRHVAAACEAYPDSHNSHNTAAWLASRAVRRLDDAQKHAELAVQLAPQQGAYIDTMAEVWFAKGDRAKAIEWSEKAVAATIGNAQGTPRSGNQALANFSQLSKQLERFKTGALPK